MNYGKIIQFFFVAFFYYAWYAYCPLYKNQVASIKYDCKVFNFPIVAKQIVFEELTYFIKRPSSQKRNGYLERCQMYTLRES